MLNRQLARSVWLGKVLQRSASKQVSGTFYCFNAIAYFQGTSKMNAVPEADNCYHSGKCEHTT